MNTLAAKLPPESIHTGHALIAIECRDGRVRRISFASGSIADVTGTVVSTLPLNRLVELLGDEPSDAVKEAARALRFRQLRLIFLRLGKPRISDNGSIYFPDPRMCVSRVSEPKNRSAALAPADETSLVAEVPCSAGEKVRRLDNQALMDRVVSEISAAGLIHPSDVLDWKHHFLEYAYPIYSLDYRRHRDAVIEGLSHLANLTTLGRNGRFSYSHFQDQLDMGRNFVAGLK